MSVEVEYTGVTIGIVLQMTVDEVCWLVKTVEEVMTEVLVLVLVTRERVSLKSWCWTLKILLADISGRDCADNGGCGWFEGRVNRSNNSRFRRGPCRRLVRCCGYNAREGFCRGLHDGRVHGRACRRCPRHSVGILNRLVGLRSVASRLCRRNDVGRGGKDRQYVERELHLGCKDSLTLSFSVCWTVKTVSSIALEPNAADERYHVALILDAEICTKA